MRKIIIVPIILLLLFTVGIARYIAPYDERDVYPTATQVLTVAQNPLSWFFGLDTNIFNSGVSDCAANEYVYGFNADGTIDCRADETGEMTADTTIDTNQPAFDSIQIDLNLFYSKYTDQNNASRLDHVVIASPPWLTSISTLDANQVDMNRFGGASYQTMQDWANLTQSAGLLVGGGITDNADGTATVAAGSGFCKAVNLAIAPVLFVSWDENTDVVFADSDAADSANKVRIDCSFDPPRVGTGTSEPTHTTQFSIGQVWKESDGTLHILEGGTSVYDLARRVHLRARELRAIERVSGMLTTETGTRNIAVTTGVFYAGNNRGTTDAFDSNGADTFRYWFYDGTNWISGDGNSTIDNTKYNDATGGTLEDLTANRYGVHWVFMHHDSHVDVVYGQGDYTAAQAADVLLPASLPALTDHFSTPIAKIIIQKGDAEFTSVETVQLTFFTKTLVDEHNDMGGIQGGTTSQYYHLTLPHYTELTDWLQDVNLFDGGDLNTNTGDVNIGGRLKVMGDGNFANIEFSSGLFGDGSTLTGIPADINKHFVPYIGADYDLNMGTKDINTFGNVQIGGAMWIGGFLFDDNTTHLSIGVP